MIDVIYKIINDKKIYRDKIKAIEAAKELQKQSGSVITVTMDDSSNNPRISMQIYPNEAYGFKIGDVVEYTNPQGVKFSPHIIVGFVEKPDPNFLPQNTVYYDSDSPWYPVKPTNLTKIN